MQKHGRFMNIATFSMNKWRFWGENMNNHNRINIQIVDTRLRVYLYRAGLKSKRNRLLCREMPFFSGGQNKSVLFANSGHKLLYIMYKSCCIYHKILHKKFLQKGWFFGILIVPKKVMKNGQNGHYSEHALF